MGLQAKANLVSEDLFRLMIEAVEGYAIYMLDIDGTVLTWNIGAERNKGYRADEIIGRNYSCFFPQESIAAGLPEYELEEARLNGKYREEGWRIRKGGQRFWADVMLTALHNPRGDHIGFVKITRDLTMRHAQDEALRIAKEKAEAASRAKSDFLANMSHELRTLLNAIMGFSKMLEMGVKGALNEQNKEYAQHIHTSAEHLLKLINEVLDLSRLGERSVQLDLEYVSLKEVLSKSVDLMRPQADSAGVRLMLDVSPDAHLWCDKTRILQILLNLLSNALKFTEPGGEVLVCGKDQEEDVVISVRDSGVGMNAEELSRALERFGQVESVFARKHQGTGLGLPLAKKLVETHGGRLQLESAPGTGTTVTIYLPKKSKNIPLEDMWSI